MVSDLELLPPDLAQRSISDWEIVLDYKDTLSALDHLVRTGRRVLGWEGWLRHADGRFGHSAQHQGTTSLGGLPADEAAAFCRMTIAEAHAQWRCSPQRQGAELYFCITVALA